MCIKVILDIMQEKKIPQEMLKIIKILTLINIFNYATVSVVHLNY